MARRECASAPLESAAPVQGRSTRIRQGSYMRITPRGPLAQLVRAEDS